MAAFRRVFCPRPLASLPHGPYVAPKPTHLVFPAPILAAQNVKTMTSRTSSPDTPELVADTATQSGALQKSSLGLLGLFGAEGDLRAMIRLPNGQVKTVQTGSRIARSRVLGIDAKGVLLESSGQTRRIEMPGS